MSERKVRKNAAREGSFILAKNSCKKVLMEIRENDHCILMNSRQIIDIISFAVYTIR